MFKTLGYAVSSLSVLLLGWVAWASVDDDPELKLALLAGMATAILGMVLRWISWWRGRRDKHAIAPSTE